MARQPLRLWVEPSVTMMRATTVLHARGTRFASAGLALEQWNESYPHPERELAAAVIAAAADDLVRYRTAHTLGPQRLYWSAHDWIGSDDRDWPYSFANLCDVLQIAPDALRARLLHATDCQPEPARPPARAAAHAA
ncbi:MAG: hypothetical protein SF182_22945 [Deltaproteobacteria bacterium]|nr:hypothetical protein [Deltaproteobacteria bacterium]